MNKHINPFLETRHSSIKSTKSVQFLNNDRNDYVKKHNVLSSVRTKIKIFGAHLGNSKRSSFDDEYGFNMTHDATRPETAI